MEKGNKVNKLLTGVLVSGMLLTFNGVAFAADAQNLSVGDNKSIVMKNKQGFMVEKKQVLSGALDQLVKEGTISKAKADQVNIYLDKKIKEKQARHEELKKLTPEQRKAFFEKKQAEKNKNLKGKSGLFDQLVKDNILSQKEADALKTKMRAIASSRHQQRISSGLKSLVNNKTITQEQADKVLKQLEEARKNHKAIFEKVKGMTPEQRQQYFKNNKTEFKNPLQQMVKDGTITEAQYEAIKKTFFSHKGH